MGSGPVCSVCLEVRACFLGLRFLTGVCLHRQKYDVQPKGSVFRAALPCGGVSAASTLGNCELFCMCIISVGYNS